VGLAVDQYDPADGGADDTRWWRCMRAWMARHDIDWGFWALQVTLRPHLPHSLLGLVSQGCMCGRWTVLQGAGLLHAPPLHM